MNNTVLGAKPLGPDGTFYYRDDNFKGHKVYQNRRCPAFQEHCHSPPPGGGDPQKWQATFRPRHDRRLALTAIRDKV